jgi:hypothetical protein
LKAGLGGAARRPALKGGGCAVLQHGSPEAPSRRFSAGTAGPYRHPDLGDGTSGFQGRRLTLFRIDVTPGTCKELELPVDKHFDIDDGSDDTTPGPDIRLSTKHAEHDHPLDVQVIPLHTDDGRIPNPHHPKPARKLDRGIPDPVGVMYFPHGPS